MLGLPRTTELHKQLPKKAIYAKFQLNSAAKEKMDADISKIVITNEISPATVPIAEGERIKTFFVVQVSLKKKNFDERTIATISKLIPQNMLLVLECGEEAKLAVYRTKLLQTGWQAKESLTVEWKGLTLDAVWESIILQVGGIRLESENTLDDQIRMDDRRQRIEKEIDRLERLAKKERQPKRKFEAVQQINKLKKELGVIE